jgi:hypothetical protein
MLENALALPHLGSPPAETGDGMRRIVLSAIGAIQAGQSPSILVV